MLPKTTVYVKRYDGQTLWMYFFIKDDDLLEKHNTSLHKVSVDIKKEFDGRPVYDQNYFKTKTKYDNEVTDFCNKKIPKLDSNHTCLAVLTLDSALKKMIVIIRRVFLKQCRYIEEKVVRHIHDTFSDFWFQWGWWRINLSGLSFFCKSVAT